MKTIDILIAVLLMLAISGTTYAQNQTQADTIMQIRQDIQPDTLVFTVYGMDCPGCEGALEKQVNKMEYVKFSQADWLKQELRLVLVKDSALKINELEKRVKKANFTLEKELKN